MYLASLFFSNIGVTYEFAVRQNARTTTGKLNCIKYLKHKQKKFEIFAIREKIRFLHK